MKKDTSHRQPKFPTSLKQIAKHYKAHFGPEHPLPPSFSLNPALAVDSAALHKELRDAAEIFRRGEKKGDTALMLKGAWHALGAAYTFCHQNMDVRFTKHLWVLRRIATDIVDLHRGNQASYLKKRSKEGKPPTNMHLLWLRAKCIVASDWLRDSHDVCAKEADQEIMRQVKGLGRATLQGWRRPDVRDSITRALPEAFDDAKAELRWYSEQANFPGRSGIRTVLEAFLGDPDCPLLNYAGR